jgi:hypothetical protein
MGKKCIPGVICIENMTLFLLIVIVVLLVYMHYMIRKRSDANSSSPSKEIVVVSPMAAPSLGKITNTLATDTFKDPYAPPLIEYPPNFARVETIRRPVVGLPVNIQTRGYEDEFQQMGILTRTSKEDMILPLMGRKIMNGRDKWQFYAISNTGSVNTKLPVRAEGRDCMSEYGCNDIMDRDVVYVGGYNDAFRVTKYANNLLRYLPIL